MNQRIACSRPIPPATVSQVPKLNSETSSGPFPNRRYCISISFLTVDPLQFFSQKLPASRRPTPTRPLLHIPPNRPSFTLKPTPPR